MIALDTNVLVRIITRDDEDQAVRAAALVAHNPVFASLTVVVEVEWVLRSVYRAERATIAEAFRTMLGIANLQLGNRAALLSALSLYDDGMDFADALHLSVTPPGASFATFDQALRRKAAGMAGVPDIVEPT